MIQDKIGESCGIMGGLKVSSLKITKVGPALVDHYGHRLTFELVTDLFNS